MLLLSANFTPTQSAAATAAPAIAAATVPAPPSSAPSLPFVSPPRSALEEVGPTTADHAFGSGSGVSSSLRRREKAAALVADHLFTLHVRALGD
jgi:hypothetical protein